MVISGGVPVGSYHAPSFGSLILGIGSLDHKVGYPKKGVWYEPTGRTISWIICPRNFDYGSVRSLVWHLMGVSLLDGEPCTDKPARRPRGPYTAYSRALVPKTIIPGIVYGTRVLKQAGCIWTLWEGHRAAG